MRTFKEFLSLLSESSIGNDGVLRQWAGWGDWGLASGWLARAGWRELAAAGVPPCRAGRAGQSARSDVTEYPTCPL